MRDTIALFESLIEAAADAEAPSTVPDGHALVEAETDTDLEVRALPPVPQAERLTEALDDLDALGETERLDEAVVDMDAVPGGDSDSEAGVDLEMDGEADVVVDRVATACVCVASRPDAEPDREGVVVTLDDEDTDAVTLTVFDRLPLVLTERETRADRDTEGEVDGLTDTDALCEFLGDREGDREGVDVSDSDGDREDDAETVEDLDADGVGRGDRDTDADVDAEGLGRGDRVGDLDACEEPLTLGSTDGDVEKNDDVLAEGVEKGVGEADASPVSEAATEADCGCIVCVAATESLASADCDLDPREVPLPEAEASSVADICDEVVGVDDTQDDGDGDVDKEAVFVGLAVVEVLDDTDGVDDDV